MKAEEILQLHGDQVYRLIRRTVYDHELHADIFQEVFLRVLSALPTFEGRSQLSTWIYSIAVRTCYDLRRRSKRDRHLSFEEWFETPGQDVTSSEDSPFDAVFNSDRELAVERALARLAPAYQLPIQLYYLEGLAYAEIAAVLKMPLGTVKTNLYRGLRKLRGIIGGGIDALV
jgi:RNA polymerase sigma-70 factor (ECF subfamily)